MAGILGIHPGSCRNNFKPRGYITKQDPGELVNLGNMEAPHIQPVFVLLGIVFVTWRLIKHVWTPESVLHRLPGPPRASYLTGNLPQFLSRHGTEFQRHVALDYGLVSKIHGPMGSIIPYISDPKALHSILIKEEDIFQETDHFFTENNLLLGPGLLSTAGDVHRRQRKLLLPAFSSTHLRSMLPLVYQIAYKLRDAISAQVKTEQEDIDMLSWMGRTALEVIGQGGLGYSFDPLVKDAGDEYGHALKHLVPSMQRFSGMRNIVYFFSKIGPAWFRRLLLDMIPYQHLQTLKKIVDTMSEKSQEIYEAKKASLSMGTEVLLEQIGEGKDIMSILMRANMATSSAESLSEYELVSQISTLVIGATDTSSNLMARILERLADNIDVQEKLRQEILDAKAGLGLSFDDLFQLPYLDNICRETLRLDPPLVFTFRTATQDTVLPLSEPVVANDGSLINELPISKGTNVLIGVLGCNANKALWGEDAFDWKPERWLSPLPSAVTKNPIPGVYSNLRKEILHTRFNSGFKFSEMEMKVVLSVLLSHFRFRPSGKPIEWNVGVVRYPTIGKISGAPQLPLKVEPLESSSRSLA
ncbi:uncharacterized protein FIBRA_04792 [Fibroporia radiculosa]|uniref:Cytochrome P450 n=1 Tax=Fibroporia radiculosa TaxID=599839 RepID=J4IAC8_9APHY|nr:uncharacterized protein FIBRA_04792 [Fibroporia radiculosa]CCM02686.1 predicted protein [Fibroporia radiculosa]